MRYMSLLRKTSYVILAISLVIFILGLYLFLCGPKEEVISLSATKDVQTTLAHKGNKTILLDPFEEGRLLEYHWYNLLEFLTGRIISVLLKVENDGKINLYIMNDTQFKYWRNSSIASGIISKEGVDNIQLTFSPKDVWGSYHLVLVNPRETDVNVHIRLIQRFFVRVLDYRHAFEWFKIAFLAIIVLLTLPIPLRLTIDDLILQIRRRLLSKYGVYTPKRPIPVFQIVLIISIIFFLVHSCSLLPSLTHFTFVGNIWEDYLYRLAISNTLLAIIFVIILSLSLNVLHFLEILLMRKCYADPDTHRKFDKNHV